MVNLGPILGPFLMQNLTKSYKFGTLKIAISHKTSLKNWPPQPPLLWIRPDEAFSVLVAGWLGYGQLAESLCWLPDVFRSSKWIPMWWRETMRIKARADPSSEFVLALPGAPKASQRPLEGPLGGPWGTPWRPWGDPLGRPLGAMEAEECSEDTVGPAKSDSKDASWRENHQKTSEKWTFSKMREKKTQFFFTCWDLRNRLFV